MREVKGIGRREEEKGKEEFFYDQEIEEEDDDDEVRRVYNTSGNPCGYIRLSPWTKHWSVLSSSLYCPQISATFLYLSLSDLSHLLRISYTCDVDHLPHMGLPSFPCFCNYSQHYNLRQGLMCPHHVTNISHFKHVCYGFQRNVWSHLTYY